MKDYYEPPCISHYMLVYAARYAHTRDTGAAAQVVSQILINWPVLSKKMKQQLKTEAIQNATSNEDYWMLIIEKEVKRGD